MKKTKNKKMNSFLQKKRYKARFPEIACIIVINTLTIISFRRSTSTHTRSLTKIKNAILQYYLSEQSPQSCQRATILIFFFSTPSPRVIILYNVPNTTRVE